jgi:hypothetical protein
MKYNFYHQDVLCFDYRRGTIVARTKKEEDSDWDNVKDEHRQEYINKYKDKYMLELYYNADFLVGFYIDNNDDKTVQNEIKRLIESGYMDNCINGSEETAEDFEEFLYEKFEKMELEKKSKNKVYNESYKAQGKLN